MQSYGASSVGTDISAVTIADNKTALIYLQPNNTIGITFIDRFPNIQSSIPNYDTSWPTVLPYNRLVATSFDSGSTKIYVYFQANGTSMSEISFDTVARAWASDAKYVSIG